MSQDAADDFANPSAAAGDDADMMDVPVVKKRSKKRKAAAGSTTKATSKRKTHKKSKGVVDSMETDAAEPTNGADHAGSDDESSDTKATFPEVRKSSKNGKSKKNGVRRCMTRSVFVDSVECPTMSDAHKRVVIGRLREVLHGFVVRQLHIRNRSASQGTFKFADHSNYIDAMTARSTFDV